MIEAFASGDGLDEDMNMRIGIVGAGMAGLACAEALVAGGHAVALFDKGRGPGGRMSTRRMATPLGVAGVDHGAQYFTVRDAGFAARVAAWAAAGVVAPWPAGGEDAWVGTPGMNAPIRDMAARLDVRWRCEISSLTRGERWALSGPDAEVRDFDAVVLALPAEQTGPLANRHDPTVAAAAAATRSEPCWTVMAAFAERVPVDRDVLRDAGPIGWAARNSAKPGRTGPEAWIVQATPAWSRDHLEDDRGDVQAILLDALAQAAATALPRPIAVDAHRWRYARSGSLGSGPLWNPSIGLGACGDWLLGPRIESAWLSGTRLARAIVAARALVAERGVAECGSLRAP